MRKLLRYLLVMKGKREQDESGPKEITPADTFGPVPAKHVMKKFGAFVTSLVVAIWSSPGLVDS